jgi:hypothetical protein
MDNEAFKKAYAEVAKKDKNALAELIVEWVDPRSLGRS